MVAAFSRQRIMHSIFFTRSALRRGGIALAMMQVDDNYLASDTKPIPWLFTLCATSTFSAPRR
jgi:hypothetical protein